MNEEYRLGDVIEAYANNDIKLACLILPRAIPVNGTNHNSPQIVTNYCKVTNERIGQAIYLSAIAHKL